ncbi:MAG TPA: 5-formyltetrahydrofolate cyclo-ligase [Ornithinibacter sp.]|nr:5-formyltetrahydrofolate cyclo-ligase [Ornithinibacter sp.]
MARDPAKSARRTERRSRRREMAATRDLPADDAALARHVRRLVEELGLGPGSVVMSYAAVPGEPPTAAVNAWLAAHGIRVLLPITLADLDLDWHDSADPGATPLGTGAVALADLVLAPGLAVDRAGTRLGQGGGCYDKALPRRRRGTPVVVVLHPGELAGDGAEPLPREAHDQPVDAVVTADGVTDLGLSPWRRRPRA